ncbi:hypothetical protein PR048_014912 [Dryococelus australis]|uniref:Uncharacterized protein n=1 Tax=Dryococelus australis TaxID=614101 RepID=A0ABQ9HGB8_9NEOP|nr:hypothetical protein PR048_014912 [Dryococelus australis]
MAIDMRSVRGFVLMENYGMYFLSQFTNTKLLGVRAAAVGVHDMAQELKAHLPDVVFLVGAGQSSDRRITWSSQDRTVLDSTPEALNCPTHRVYYSCGSFYYGFCSVSQGIGRKGSSLISPDMKGTAAVSTSQIGACLGLGISGVSLLYHDLTFPGSSMPLPAVGGGLALCKQRLSKCGEKDVSTAASIPRTSSLTAADGWYRRGRQFGRSAVHPELMNHHVRECVYCSPGKKKSLINHGTRWHEKWIVPQGHLAFQGLTPGQRQIDVAEAQCNSFIWSSFLQKNDVAVVLQEMLITELQKETFTQASCAETLRMCKATENNHVYEETRQKETEAAHNAISHTSFNAFTGPLTKYMSGIEIVNLHEKRIKICQDSVEETENVILPWLPPENKGRPRNEVPSIREAYNITTGVPPRKLLSGENLGGLIQELEDLPKLAAVAAQEDPEMIKKELIDLKHCKLSKRNKFQVNNLVLRRMSPTNKYWEYADKSSLNLNPTLPKEFDLEFRHIKDVNNVAADYLSHIHDGGSGLSHIRDECTKKPLIFSVAPARKQATVTVNWQGSFINIKQDQQQDKFCSTIISKLQEVPREHSVRNFFSPAMVFCSSSQSKFDKWKVVV